MGGGGGGKTATCVGGGGGGGRGGELTSAWKWGGSTDPLVSPF